MLSRPSPPADHEQQWNAKHLLRSQRLKGVERVCKTRVLHVRNCEVLGGQIVASGQADGSALAGCDDVLWGFLGGVHVG
ncbi:hypothetical protein HG530_014683 [Fusarium avenaceum]|nr:hypothetical protein HG530_014683 [Fusarium avenaceum]